MTKDLYSIRPLDEIPKLKWSLMANGNQRAVTELGVYWIFDSWWKFQPIRWKDGLPKFQGKRYQKIEVAKAAAQAHYERYKQGLKLEGER